MPEIEIILSKKNEKGMALPIPFLPIFVQKTILFDLAI